MSDSSQNLLRRPTSGRAAPCPNCGMPIPAHASESLCPTCLLGGVLSLGNQRESPGVVDPLPPLLLGEFEILEKIGRGGMGVVFRAYQPSLQRDVALKLIASGKLASPEDLRRFRLEAEAAARLDHPNIVPIYAIGEDAGQHYFAMRLAEGGALDASAPIDQRDAAILVEKIARGVQFAHDRGVLHRDLKPANILIDAAGAPMIADFGLAKLTHSDSSLTLAGTALGTPSYMPPEQARGNAAEVTTAADIYSLGAILYHLLTGAPPFGSDANLETLRRIESEEPAPPRRIAALTDTDLEIITLKCLEKSPEKRYVNAAALGDDLRAWLNNEPIAARPATAIERLRKWTRRRPVVAASTLLGAVAMLVLGAVLVVANLMLKQEREVALELADRIEASHQDTRLNLYAADIFLTSRAIEDGNFGVARHTLKRQIPSPDQPDLRGFEWFALKELCRGDDRLVIGGHSGAVTCAAFSPDGKRLASGSRDGTMLIRSLANPDKVLTLPKDGAPKGASEFLLFSKLVASSAEARRAVASPEMTFDEIRMRARPSALGEVLSLAWSPDGKWLASGSGGAFVRIWDTTNLNLRTFIPLQAARTIAFTPDGTALVIGTSHSHHDGNVFVYGTDDWQPVREISNARPAFAISPDSSSLWVSFYDSAIERQDLMGGEVEVRWNAEDRILKLALSPDGKRIATLGTNGGQVTIREITNARTLARISSGESRFHTLEFSPDGEHLAIGGTDQSIQLYETSKYTKMAVLRGHEDEVLAIQHSPLGGTIASACNDHTVRLWEYPPESVEATVRSDQPEKHEVKYDSDFLTVVDSASGIELHRIDTGGYEFSKFALSRDATHIAALKWPRTLCVWDLESGKKIPEWKASIGTVNCFQFSPDNRLLASGGDDNLITVRDLQTNKTVVTLRGHQAELLALAFTPDGRTLASSSRDRSIRLWHPRTWRDLGVFHRGELVGDLEFSPDGRILSATYEGRTRFHGASSSYSK